MLRLSVSARARTQRLEFFHHKDDETAGNPWIIPVQINQEDVTGALKDDTMPSLQQVLWQEWFPNVSLSWDGNSVQPLTAATFNAFH